MYIPALVIVMGPAVAAVATMVVALTKELQIVMQKKKFTGTVAAPAI